MCPRAEGTLLPVAERSLDVTPISLSWIPSSVRFCIVGTDKKGKGNLSVQSLNGREIVETESVTIETPLRCATLNTGSISDRMVATGDFSGDLSTWDLETLKRDNSVKAHSDVVTCVAGSGEGSSQLLTGGRDGEVKLWDERTLDVPVLRMLPETGHARKECWTVCHGDIQQDQSFLIAAGFDNGDIKVFDVRNSKIAWETSLPRGVSNLSVFKSNDHLKLVGGTVQGKIYQWNLENPENSMKQNQLEDKSTVWVTQSMNGPERGVICTSLGSGGLIVVDDVSLETVVSHQVAEHPLTGLSACSDKPGLLAVSSFDKNISILYYTGLK